MATTQHRLEPTADMLEVQGEIREIEGRLPNYSMNLMWLLMFATVIDGFDRSLFSTVLEDIRREFDLSDGQLGLLTGAYATVAAISVLPFGFLTDRMRRTLLIALGFIPWSLGMAWQGIATGYAMVFGARMFLGFLEATNGPATASLLGDYYPVRMRSRIFGLLGISNIAGYAAGPIFGGITVAWWGWRAAFVFWGGVGAVAGLIIWKFLPEPPRGLQDAKYRLETRLRDLRIRERRKLFGEDTPELPEFENPVLPTSVLGPEEFEEAAVGVQATQTDEALMASVTDPLVVQFDYRPLDADQTEGPPVDPSAGPYDYRRLDTKQVTRAVMRIKTVWIMLIAQLLVAFSTSAMATWPATFYRRYHGVSVTGAGLITGLNALTALVGIIIAARIGAKMVSIGKPQWRVYVIAVAFLVEGIFWGMAFWVDFTPISLHFLVFGSIFATMPAALTPALTTDVVNPYLRGRTGALTSIARVGGTALAPIIFGVIADYTGLRAALILVMPATIIGCLVVLPAAKTYPPDAEFQQSESVRQHRLELEEVRQAELAAVTASQSADVDGDGVDDSPNGSRPDGGT
jgi:MFS family permease